MPHPSGVELLRAPAVTADVAAFFVVLPLLFIILACGFVVVFAAGCVALGAVVSILIESVTADMGIGLYRTPCAKVD